MRTRNIITLLLTLNPIVALADFKVHEWGTFTSLLGSNGASQDGMYHEDEKLPDFVYGFGDSQNSVSQLLASRFPDIEPALDHRSCEPNEPKCVPRRFLQANVITQKMETPVIYFYNTTGKPVRARVDVRFPEGVITETFPAPVSTFPTRDSEPVMANGHTVFDVSVSPIRGRNTKLPSVPAGNIYGHARNVDSNYVTSGNDREQFIFYRGLGRFQPVTQITSNEEGLRIRQPEGAGNIPAVFLVHVNKNGQPALQRLGALAAGEEISLSQEDVEGVVRRTKRLAAPQATFEIEQLVTALDAAGLNQDEAQAMVDTWIHGYLGTPGLRVLYILPRQEVESILPLTITSSPVQASEIERVFVGRIEVLLHTEEQRILKDFLTLGDRFDPASLGRMAEPTLRRIREVYVSSFKPMHEVLQRFDRLIEQVSDR